MHCRVCGKLSPYLLCPKHQAERHEHNKSRWRTRAAKSFYHTPTWARLARACVRRDRECLVCGSRERLTANHIIPRGGETQPYDPTIDSLANLMAMCGSCHSRYESDTRRDINTELRRAVDQIRAALIETRKLQ